MESTLKWVRFLGIYGVELVMGFGVYGLKWVRG